jgi:uncharacterized membrane protein
MSDLDPRPADGLSPKQSMLLGAAVVLGLVNALWAEFQWAELMLARMGTSPFCDINETFNCGAVWESPFAKGVHEATRLPVAAWGLVWSLAATLLPLLALVRPRLLGAGAGAALRLTALAGLGAVGGLATASFVAGALCLGCIGTYVLVGDHAFVVWRATSGTGFSELTRGFAFAGACVVGGYLILLYPGTQTPQANKNALKLADIAKPVGAAKAPPKAPTAPTGPTGPTGPAAPAGPSPFDGPPTGDPARDELLQKFVGSLDPQGRQMLSDMLLMYRRAPQQEPPTARHHVIGGAGAPLKMTEWTDVLCPHCAMLHATVGEIHRVVAPGLFSVDARQFPLDGVCNSGVGRKSEDGLRCVAAKAQLCLEGNPRHFEASGVLFEGRPASVDAVYQLLTPFISPAKLKACIESKETDAKLQDDIKFALERGLEGTPLVLLNGKEARPFGPLLYALVLTSGSDSHPAFKALPPPREPREQPGHEGHGH